MVASSDFSSRGLRHCTQRPGGELTKNNLPQCIHCSYFAVVLTGTSVLQDTLSMSTFNKSLISVADFVSKIPVTMLSTETLNFSSRDFLNSASFL